MKYLLLSLSFLACEDSEKIVEIEEGNLIIDSDDDGFSENDDCDDYDPLVNPSAEELCDGIDNNCDGNVDEDVLQTFYLDADGDGFGSPDITIEACGIPDDFVNTGTDCNDQDASVYPSAEEICDQRDNNCNGEIDEDGLTEYHIDADGDGYGDPSQVIQACDLREGISLFDSDCNDQDASIFPTAEEICDSIDNNCDGNVDEGVLELFYLDADGDGYGDNFTTEEACEVPENYTTIAGDCNDIQQFINPNAIEYCDAADNDCDGDIDEADSIGELTFYLDSDGDGFGDINQTTLACSQPFGYIDNADDCDDSDTSSHPDADEFCDSIDHNCDGSTDANSIDAPTWYIDVDSDGFGSDSFTIDQCTQPAGYVADNTDCNDILATAYPNAAEICDSADNDCDGLIDDDDSSLDLSTTTTFYTDLDSDGYGDPAFPIQSCSAPLNASLLDNDCDDSDPLISPIQLELCDSIDNNCDGNSDEAGAFGENTYYLDADEDGYGDINQTALSCTQPAGYIDNSDDCNDSLPEISPAADELCDSTDHNCDGSTDADAIDGLTWYIDVDADGFGSDSFTTEQCTQPAGYVADNTDCNDILATAYPNASEICDSADNDCDGDIDDDDSSLDLSTTTTFYADIDGDGEGDLNSTTQACTAPLNYVSNYSDCDDGNSNINLVASEICDGLDNNCNNQTDEGVFATSASCPAASCLEILDAGESVGDDYYWLDPDEDGDFSDAWEAYCDMTRDGGGWTKIESAVYPYFFTHSNWESVGVASDNNYSAFSEVYDLAENGIYYFRLEVGNSGTWLSENRAHYTVWTQEHHPAYETTDGSGYTFIDGEESTTCNGFNGLHNKYYLNSGVHTVISDVDSTEGAGCWWQQILPLADYNGNGYLEGYGGPNYHVWQSMWIR